MCVCVRSDPPLNNQLSALAALHVAPSTGDPALDRRPSLLVGGPPRGITLSRQNSISSQTPADKSAPRPGAPRASACLSPAGAVQPANDARDKTIATTTTTPTTIGDQSDVVGENVARNLEASALPLLGGAVRSVAISVSVCLSMVGGLVQWLASFVA